MMPMPMTRRTRPFLDGSPMPENSYLVSPPRNGEGPGGGVWDAAPRRPHPPAPLSEAERGRKPSDPLRAQERGRRLALGDDDDPTVGHRESAAPVEIQV